MTIADVLIKVQGGVLSARRADPTPKERVQGGPLIVALHGGSYSSMYFGIPGYSLLDRAAERGVSAVAIDRPGYGMSTLPEALDSLLDANAELLDAAIEELWNQETNASGIVVVGHSIGSAITTLIAARRPGWPLLGVAVSALRISAPDAGPVYEERESPTSTHVEVPPELKTAAMFGPVGSFAPDAPSKAATANAPVVYREIFEMNARWSLRAEEVFGKVTVPVHYRQGEHDAAGIQGPDELERVQRAFVNAPRVDAQIVAGAGHAIDFHSMGAALHEEQISFALACAIEHQSRRSIRASTQVSRSEC